MFGRDRLVMSLTASSVAEERILLNSKVGDAVFGFYIFASILFAVILTVAPLEGLAVVWTGTGIFFAIGVAGLVWREQRYILGMALSLVLYPLSIMATWHNGLYFLSIVPVLSVTPILLLSNKLGLILSSGFLLLFSVPVISGATYDENLFIRLFTCSLILIAGIHMFVRFTKQRLEESRQQQIELEAANAALEVGRQELVLANEELIAQQELLDDQAQRQAQMYAVIAHELRTPAAILKMILDSKDREKDGVDYSLIGGLSDQLLEVLDSLRSVARPEEMLLTATRPVRLTEILRNQVELMGVIGCDQGVGLASDFSDLGDGCILTQSQLIQQALRNLINNAILHSGGDQVLISASERDAGQDLKTITIVVEDNGQGIAPEKAERLFNAFERGDTRADGTGLGLSITREISKKLSGDLRYEPNPKGGSRFILEFSAKAAISGKVSSLHKEKTGGDHLKGKSVLVVDDNLTIRVLAQSMLEKIGAKVDVATNGREALLAVCYQDFDLIMTDVFMPEMDGIELVKELRAQGRTAKIIGMSASSVSDELDRIIEAGADGVVNKPFDVHELNAALIKAFDGEKLDLGPSAATG
jgi:signal transduction histidine kinase/ActR/RegA family two-component response regulator